MQPAEDDEEVPEPDEDVLLEEDEEAQEQAEDVRVCHLMSNAIFNGFEAHVGALEAARERRREALAFKSAVEEGVGDDGNANLTQDQLDGLGVWVEDDKYQGDVNMRTLQKLLARVDARGFERSAQQLEFHDAFTKAAARVVYKGDWETDRPMIMDKYNWSKCNSEVLVSTPRRFGKTYRCLKHTYIVSNH